MIERVIEIVAVAAVRGGRVLLVRSRQFGVSLPAATAEGGEHYHLQAMHAAVRCAGLQLGQAGPGLGKRKLGQFDVIVYQATAHGDVAHGPEVDGAWWGDPEELLAAGASADYAMALAAIANAAAGFGRLPNRPGEGERLEFRAVLDNDPEVRRAVAVSTGPEGREWSVYLGDNPRPFGQCECASPRTAIALVAGRAGWALAELRGPGEHTTAERVRLATATAVSECQGKIRRLEYGESQGGERWRAMVECREALGVPEPTCTAPRRSVVLIVEREGLFAAIRSNKYGGGVSAPGGKVEPGELLTVAAHREGREELGVKRLRVTASLGSYVHMHDGVIWECFAYVGDVEDQELTGSPEGPAAWVTREELTSGPHGAVIAHVLAAYDANVRDRP